MPALDLFPENCGFISSITKSSQLYMATVCGPEPTLSQLVLLLLGEKQSGKTAVGNSILGKQASHKSTTQSCKKKGDSFGVKVTVVDTPGWLSHSTTPDRVSREISRGLELCHPGPHAILLVLPISTTFGQVEWRAMEAQLRLLQTFMWQQAMVLFTHGDKLGGLPIQDHIKQQGRNLQWLLERCSNRYHILTNQSSTSQAEIKELFEKIKKMMITKYPREIQHTEPRQNLSIREEQTWRTTQEEGVPHRYPGQRKQMVAGCSYIPRARLGGQKPGLSLILLGRRKSGKSSAGNMILDRDEFQSGKKTISCSASHAEVSDWLVTVVDTPGWSLFGLANPELVRKEIIRSPSLCPVRSKVIFILAVPVGSFREKDRRAVEMYLRTLGDNVWRRTTVLFTYGDILTGKTIYSNIKRNGEPLKWVLDRCDHRYYVCDTNAGDRAQVNQILRKAEIL